MLDQQTHDLYGLPNVGLMLGERRRHEAPGGNMAT